MVNTSGLKRMLAGKGAAKSAEEGGRLKTPDLGPTAEQMRRAKFEKKAVDTNRGQVGRNAYRRLPWFETLAKSKKPGTSPTITPAGLKALRFYRSTFEDGEASETKSCLDVRPRGNGESQGLPPAYGPGVARARRMRGEIEGQLLGTIGTMRAVAIHDLTFADVAMERYGSRQVDYIIAGKTETKLAPKSGRHRELVRAEFLAGVELLIVATRQYGI